MAGKILVCYFLGSLVPIVTLNIYLAKCRGFLEEYYLSVLPHEYRVFLLFDRDLYI